jgi:SAM-dependent methyltransferase
MTSRNTVLFLKRLFFPGLDLHTRNRYRVLPRYFLPGPIDTLDAGCGNGALAFAAYRLGNRVSGITNDEQEVEKARQYFRFVGANPERLRFEVMDLYELGTEKRKFDQIICSETLEHIANDALIVRHFSSLLRSGGFLHLCAPYARHPAHNLGRIDGPEDGGHVRDGYTLNSFRELLDSENFRIDQHFGLCSPIVQRMDRPVRWVRNRLGDLAAIPLFVIGAPIARIFDRHDPAIPFSIYVRAVKL